jgi:signal transduction histidine kinase
METLIDDLLSLARTGEATGPVSPTAVGAVARESWEGVPTREATLEVVTDPQVVADAERLRELLENLFHNAVQHGGPRVTVTVGATADGFFVADDGPGVPASERDAVFEPGYTTADSGTGFGLRIVSEIADAHDWEVDLEESASGGARFTVRGVEFA